MCEDEVQIKGECVGMWEGEVTANCAGNFGDKGETGLSPPLLRMNEPAPACGAVKLLYEGP